MEDTEKNDLIRFMYQQWRKDARERIVFQTALRVILLENPNLETTLDKLVATCRGSGAVDKRLDAEFSGFGELLDTIGEGTMEKLARLIQERQGSKAQIH